MLAKTFQFEINTDCGQSAINSNINLFLCVLTSVNFIKIVRIHDGDLRDSDVYMNDLLPEISKRIQIPLIIETFPVDYEEKTFQFKDRYSAERKLLPLRPNQKKKSIMVNPETDQRLIDENNPPSHFGVIIVVTKLEHLNKYCKGTARPPLNNPRGLFVIVVLEKVDLKKTMNKKILDSVLERLWRYYGIQKAAIAFYCTGNEFFYFHPFELKKIEINENHELTRWGQTFRDNLEQSTKYCNRTLPNLYANFNRYPLRVHSALESESWKHYVTRKNQKPLDNGILVQGFGYATKAIASLLFERMNFEFVASDQEDTPQVIHGGAIKHTRSEFDILHPIEFFRICIVTPKAAVVPRFMGFVRCFAPSTWAMIIVGHFILVVCFIFIRRFYRGHRISATALFQDIVQAYSSDSQFNPNVNMRAAQRIVLIVFLFYVLTVDGIYEGFLTTWFTTITHYRDIQTLEEVDQSGCLIHTGDSIWQQSLFKSNDTDPVIRSLSAKMHLTDNFFHSLQRIANGENICCVIHENHFEILKLFFPTESGAEPFHLVPECPQANMDTIKSRKNWSLEDRFNLMLSQLDAAGLFDYWQEKSLHYLKMKAKIQNRKGVVDARRPINLIDLQFPFYILGIGLTIAFCAFILEWLYSRLHKNR